MKRLVSPVGLAVAVVIFLLVNTAASVSLRGARADLTEDGLFSLSEGSRNIVADLAEPITVTFYFSSAVAADYEPLMAYADRVQWFLEEYVAASNGMIQLRRVEPEPFSEEEDEAVAAGIQAVRGQSADAIYFGLIATNTTDGHSVVPFFDSRREQFLEHDLSKLLHELTEPERPVLAILSSLPIQGTPPAQFPGAPPPVEPWYVLDQLQQSFELRGVDPAATSIEADVDVLLVHHPKGLSDQMLYAIDQFALGGGGVIALVDPFSEEDQPPQDPNNPFGAMGQPRNSDLNRLLEAWGARMLAETVAADRSLALEVTTGSQNRPERVPFVAWLGTTERNMVSEDLVTSNLGTLMLPAPGILEPVEGAGTTFEPLVTTSDTAMRMPVNKLQFFPDPKALLAEYQPGTESLVLAARLSGTARTAFPDGPPDGPDTGSEDDEEPDGPDAVLAHRTSAPINVVVVADADFIADRWWVQLQNFFGQRMGIPISDNASLLLNAAENLTGSNDLISVRSRGTFSRPFVALDEIRREAESRLRAEEQLLQEELRTTERTLADLQKEREDGTSLLLTEEQRAEITKFQEQRLTTRKRLRDVQHDLDKDIERVQNLIKLGNMLVAPLAIVLLMLGLAYVMRKVSSSVVETAR